MLLPSPLEDADGPPSDQADDLITPTPRILQNRTGYFGQDALERLKQNDPVSGGRGGPASAHLLQNNVQHMTPHHDAAGQDAAVVDLLGNLQGNHIQGNDYVADFKSFAGVGRPTVVSPAPKYPNLPRFPIRPSFPTQNYPGVPSDHLRDRLTALRLPLQTLDRHLEPSPRFQTPQLGASDSSSPSNGSELPTPSTRYHTPAPLPSPFLPTLNSPSHASARPSPVHSPAPSSRSLSSASRSASRCSSNSSLRASLKMESHPRLGAVSSAPRVKRGRPPPVPAIPERYRRERSAERWLKLPYNGEEAKGRRGSGGSLGTLRQAKSMENLSHIGYKMEGEVTEIMKSVKGKHATRRVPRLGVSIQNIACELPLFVDRDSEEKSDCTSPNDPGLECEITTLAPSLPRSRSPSVLVHGPVLHVDETFEEGMNWLHIKSFQGESGETLAETTPNWFERSRTPSPIRTASPYLTAFYSPARNAGGTRAKASGPGTLAKKLSGSFVKVSRGLRHVTSSSGLGIMIGHEVDSSRSSSRAKDYKDRVDGRATPLESASLGGGSDSTQFDRRADSWKDPNSGRYRESRWSARDAVVRSLESEPSLGVGDRESLRLVDFLNEVSVVLPILQVTRYRTEGVFLSSESCDPRSPFSISSLPANTRAVKPSRRILVAGLAQ